MKADRVVGLIFTVSYTLLVIAGIQADASGAVQDLVPWLAVMLLMLAYGSFLLTDRQVAEIAGGRHETMIRAAALVIQVALLAWSGWWWTIAIRVSTELVSGYRIWIARHHLAVGFAVEEDEHGQFYIHCFECGRSSYSLNDIDQLYCGACNRFHGHRPYPV